MFNLGKEVDLQYHIKAINIKQQLRWIQHFLFTVKLIECFWYQSSPH